jgi:hypothetical protein
VEALKELKISGPQRAPVAPKYRCGNILSSSALGVASQYLLQSSSTMLSLNKVSILVSVLFTAVQVNAQDLVAFTGSTCNGDVSLDIACDDTCFDFTGRHSFEASKNEQIMQINTDTSSLDHLGD